MSLPFVGLKACVTRDHSTGAVSGEWGHGGELAGRLQAAPETETAAAFAAAPGRPKMTMSGQTKYREN